MYHKSERIVNDFFDQGNDIFNLTKNKPYCLFVDNVDLLKFRVIKKSGEMSIVINSRIVPVDSDYFIFSETVEDLKIFGCFLDGIFDNWIPYITETRVNKITIR